jgi:hypothetical protein
VAGIIVSNANAFRSVLMPTISLKAHFDGTAIRLDEPCELPQGVPLLVTVSEVRDADTERLEWSALSARGLARAYGDSEPDYSVADVTP